MNSDVYWMKKAIAQAQKAALHDEVPIGCVIVSHDKIVSRAFNQREKKQSSIAHAEILAIEKACKKLGSWRLEDCTLYVTLEPCPMCTGAIIQSRIPRVVFGAYDPKGGCMGSCTNLIEVKGFNHYPVIEGGVLQEECASLLKAFFREKRKK
ncbi:tRNA adenosine(34) deaminase TadA [Faecalicoccus acidiformans]|uniref:tRNA-specific adenosine deaminase n=1 Tax=Faecalicoccus acidiformans TaxID=915173 RepID=A0ABS2FNY1_9FIRM|nr:tRNA adenosine(34) deaminase TadA [Faecalicoccus acidiformans]MBM6831728.1 nucleoside deaminase [Faecalicoccus acidiformans]MDM8203785.1 tRNA adenosine(34) deaminase TadA [Faecalicoccus acidiformans]